MKSLACLALGVALLMACPDRLPAADKSYTFAVIPKGTTHEFWKSIHAGAIKAQQELAAQGTRVDIIWKGPLREDDREQQIQVVENFVVQKVDGILLAPLDSHALVRPVNNAIRAGVPVMIFDSALNTKQPASYIATDNFKGGQMAAEYLAQLLKGRGKIILLRYQIGSGSTEAREAGFLDVLKKKYPQIEILSDNQYSGATREMAYQAAQNLLNRFGKKVDGIFAPCEPVTIGVILALKRIGRSGGNVKLVGFDAGTQSVEGLIKGDIQGLIVQNPVQMGYLGVTKMVQHLQGKPVEKVIDTGVHLVTKENMNQPAIHELLHPPLDKYLK